MDSSPNQVFASVTVTPATEKTPSTLSLRVKNPKNQEDENTFHYQLPPNNPVLASADSLLTGWKTRKLVKNTCTQLVTSYSVFCLELDQDVPYVHASVPNAASDEGANIAEIDVTSTEVTLRFAANTPLEEIAELAKDLCAKGLRTENDLPLAKRAMETENDLPRPRGRG